MRGETDLAAMLSSLTIERRRGTFAYVTVKPGDARRPASVEDAAAMIVETEGVTYVLPSDAARDTGYEIEFEAAWLTVSVHSSLAAVGLTAACSRALAEAGIACNMLAGFYHDHLLVPADRVDDAVTALESLAHRRAV